ncbi:hypothetical protein CgunFtcFv8_007048 [Champsocephalus gunnari]|uniref:Uncharacterized protein n=1 Tax=Champsocephalus gunnari TaxID=52237 RepID=A0AAN8CG32_CHAGU|nr:hypothetical protein CgunFtcFv8_007048 [Champsocephalus gunnari]
MHTDKRAHYHQQQTTVARLLTADRAQTHSEQRRHTLARSHSQSALHMSHVNDIKSAATHRPPHTGGQQIEKTKPFLPLNARPYPPSVAFRARDFKALNLCFSQGLMSHLGHLSPPSAAPVQSM